jgi:hypothetical protein
MMADMMLNFIESQETFDIAMVHVGAPTGHLAIKVLVFFPCPFHSTSKQTFQLLLCSFSIHFFEITRIIPFKVQLPYFMSLLKT